MERAGRRVTELMGAPRGAHIGRLMGLGAAPQEAVPVVSAEEEVGVRQPEDG